MKTPSTFLYSFLFTLMAPLAVVAQDDSEVAGEGEAFDNPPLFEDFGYLMAQNAKQLDPSQEEIEAFLKGVRQALEGSRSGVDLEALNRSTRAGIGQRYQAVAQKKAASFFDELEEDEDVQKAESGLYYEIIEPGSDTKADQSDEVKVHYTGTLVDGTVFDSSRERGQPATFPVSGVVPGFSEGVQLVGEGGRVKLYIPSELGYGPRAQGPIPPNSTLIFDVEVIDVIEDEG